MKSRATQCQAHYKCSRLPEAESVDMYTKIYNVKGKGREIFLALKVKAVPSPST